MANSIFSGPATADFRMKRWPSSRPNRRVNRSASGLRYWLIAVSNWLWDSSRSASSERNAIGYLRDDAKSRAKTEMPSMIQTLDSLRWKCPLNLCCQFQIATFEADHPANGQKVWMRTASRGDAVEFLVSLAPVAQINPTLSGFEVEFVRTSHASESTARHFVISSAKR